MCRERMLGRRNTQKIDHLTDLAPGSRHWHCNPLHSTRWLRKRVARIVEKIVIYHHAYIADARYIWVNRRMRATSKLECKATGLYCVARLDWVDIHLSLLAHFVERVDWYVGSRCTDRPKLLRITMIRMLVREYHRHYVWRHDEIVGKITWIDHK